jgi:hypothetical protein
MGLVMSAFLLLIRLYEVARLQQNLWTNFPVQMSNPIFTAEQTMLPSSSSEKAANLAATTA